MPSLRKSSSKILSAPLLWNCRGILPGLNPPTDKVKWKHLGKEAFSFPLTYILLPLAPPPHLELGQVPSPPSFPSPVSYKNLQKCGHMCGKSGKTREIQTCLSRARHLRDIKERKTYEHPNLSDGFEKAMQWKENMERQMTKQKMTFWKLIQKWHLPQVQEAHSR